MGARLGVGGGSGGGIEANEAVLRVLRECFHKWEDYATDVYCPIGECEFQTNGPKDGGSGFVTLEMYIHLMTHSAEQLEAYLR